MLFQTLERYLQDVQVAQRLDARREILIEPFKADIQGSRVLDIAAHDGRWSYAFAQAGAAAVVGVEARQNLIDEFETFPKDGHSARVSLHCGDAVRFLETEADANAKYDIIANFEFFYHSMEHFRLFWLMKRLKPKLILIDSEFLIEDDPIIQITNELLDRRLNSHGDSADQQVNLLGTMSVAAIEKFADVYNFSINWLNWDDAQVNDRGLIADYYSLGSKRRMSCVLKSMP